MDIKKYFLDYLLVIFLISIHHGFCLFEDDYDELPAFGRCPRIRSKLKNGRVRLRYKGRVAKFLCDSGYELAGKRSSTCVRGQWSNPTPVCVARGCNRVPSIANGRVTEMYRGSLLVYDCNPGYTLSGDISIHCDGRQWNATPPICTVNLDVLPETRCDFESPLLCGWTHDPTHDFDWRRNQFATPSGHVGTGPSHDHTFGENKAGYYLYVEASSPRKINDTARLFSPVYPAYESGGCFTFWYHMYGATTGGLRVYFKPESHVFGELSPKWEKFGDQGNQWLRGNISVPFVTENFQIVIEGIRGESYVGDSAIDDVKLTAVDCQAVDNENDTTSEVTAANSCRGRCRSEADSLAEESCECKESCLASRTCCNDYQTLCSDGNETLEQNTNEPEPGDYYGKSIIPLTETITRLPATTEMQTSSTSFKTSPQLSSQSFIIAHVSSVPVSTSTTAITSETIPSSLPLSSTYFTNDTTTISSTGTTFATELQTVTPIHTIATSTASPVINTSSDKSSTSISSTTSKTFKHVSSTSTNPVTLLSVTNNTSTTSKTTSVASNASQPTTLVTSPLITTITTQRSTTTTPVPTTPVPTTPVPTTPVPTTPVLTTPVPTTQSTTTTTTLSNVATTQSSTTTTPVSTTITTSSTSTTSRKMSSTTLTPVPVTFIQSTTFSSLVSTAARTSFLTQSSTVPDTTTRRYNLRPRTRTSTSTSPITTSLTKTSPITSSTTISTPKFESSTISSVTRPTHSRWRLNFTFPSTSTASSTKKSTTILPLVRSTYAEYTTKTIKYPIHVPISTSTLSESYDMVPSKTESTKSNSRSSIVVGVVVFVIICIVGSVIFYIRRYRRKRLSKLDDDSEMRFLPENDYMEYSDATTLDRILAK